MHDYEKPLIPEIDSLCLRLALMDKEGPNSVNGKNSTLGRENHKRIYQSKKREGKCVGEKRERGRHKKGKA